MVFMWVLVRFVTQETMMVTSLTGTAPASWLMLSSPDCVVFLGETLYSHSAPLHPGVYKGKPATSTLVVTL